MGQRIVTVRGERVSATYARAADDAASRAVERASQVSRDVRLSHVTVCASTTFLDASDDDSLVTRRILA